MRIAPGVVMPPGARHSGSTTASGATARRRSIGWASSRHIAAWSSTVSPSPVRET